MYSIIKNQSGALGSNHIIMKDSAVNAGIVVGHIYFDSDLPLDDINDFKNKLSAIGELLKALEDMVDMYGPRGSNIV